MAIAAWATSSIVGESETALRLWSVVPFVAGVTSSRRGSTPRRRPVRRPVPLPRHGLAAPARHHPPGARLRAGLPRDERPRRRRARGRARRTDAAGRGDVRGGRRRNLDAAPARHRLRRDRGGRCERRASAALDGDRPRRLRRRDRGVVRAAPRAGPLRVADPRRPPDQHRVARHRSDRPGRSPGPRLDRRDRRCAGRRLAPARRDRRARLSSEPTRSRAAFAARALRRPGRDDPRALDHARVRHSAVRQLPARPRLRAARERRRRRSSDASERVPRSSERSCASSSSAFSPSGSRRSRRMSSLLPREANRDAAEVIERTVPSSTPVFAYVRWPENISFYLGRPVRPLDDSTTVAERVCSNDRHVVYVWQPFTLKEVRATVPQPPGRAALPLPAVRARERDRRVVRPACRARASRAASRAGRSLAVRTAASRRVRGRRSRAHDDPQRVMSSAGLRPGEHPDRVGGRRGRDGCAVVRGRRTS